MLNYLLTKQVILEAFDHRIIIKILSVFIAVRLFIVTAWSEYWLFAVRNCVFSWHTDAEHGSRKLKSESEPGMVTPFHLAILYFTWLGDWDGTRAGML